MGNTHCSPNVSLAVLETGAEHLSSYSGNYRAITGTRKNYWGLNDYSHWESENAEHAIWLNSGNWQVGPKENVGTSEGILQGGLIGFFCPHAVAITGDDGDGWLDGSLPGEQQWEYKSANDVWTKAGNHGVFTYRCKL